jgi:beta-phosphoglucomutase
MLPVRALILDLDGVVTDTAEQHLAAWGALADRLGVPLPDDVRDRLRGRSREDSLRLILGERSASLGDDAVRALLDAKNADYLAAVARMGPHDVLPGALALIARARALGLAVAIGSASRNARRILERLDLAERFDAIAVGTTVERAKPAPDVFLAAARLVDVEPAACLGVEDAAAGIEAARAAGMRCVGIGPDARVGAADLVLPSVEALDLDAVLARLVVVDGA